ncbi:MAG: nucleoside 2-deoxyribosyltransferase, partial [Candidatus Heimdallarchaeota archaeon]|nr:nucleoside 2-deoxyribosyltransferase [Candidatus Heimdallarchaeota archaeon]
MKIYFAGSIRGGRKDAELYRQIIEYLKTIGTVLTEHIGDANLSSQGEQSKEQYIHDRDLDWITKCDIVVAEVSNPSLGVGYEIRDAISKNKKVLCLYYPQKDKQLSAMIQGSSKVT